MAGLKQPALCCRQLRPGGCWPRRRSWRRASRRSWSMSATTGPGTTSMVEEVAPAFEKATGIKIDFTLLPVDPWRARLQAELGAGSSGIDIAQWSVSMAGWMAPHMEDHEPLLAQIKATRSRRSTGTTSCRHASKAATYDGKLCGIPYRITTGIFHYQKALLEKAGFAKPPGTWERVPEDRAGGEHAARSLRLRHHGHAGAGHVFQLRVLAVLQRRAAGRLQDRRDLHQRAQGGGGAAVLWRSR